MYYLYNLTTENFTKGEITTSAERRHTAADRIEALSAPASPVLFSFPSQASTPF